MTKEDIKRRLLSDLDKCTTEPGLINQDAAAELIEEALDEAWDLGHDSGRR